MFLLALQNMFRESCLRHVRTSNQARGAATGNKNFVIIVVVYRNITSALPVLFEMICLNHELYQLEYELSTID